MFKSCDSAEYQPSTLKLRLISSLLYQLPLYLSMYLKHKILPSFTLRERHQLAQNLMASIWQGWELIMSSGHRVLPKLLSILDSKCLFKRMYLAWAAWKLCITPLREQRHKEMPKSALQQLEGFQASAGLEGDSPSQYVQGPASTPLLHVKLHTGKTRSQPVPYHLRPHRPF